MWVSNSICICITCVFQFIYLFWLAIGGWYSPVSSINKTDQYDITEILLKVALNTITTMTTFIYLFIWFIYLFIYLILDHTTQDQPQPFCQRLPRYRWWKTWEKVSLYKYIYFHKYSLCLFFSVMWCRFICHVMYGSLLIFLQPVTVSQPPLITNTNIYYTVFDQQSNVDSCYNYWRHQHNCSQFWN